MDNRRLYDQVMTIFGTAMVFFYLGLGYILLFSSLFTYVDVTLRTILAMPLLIYGFYRALTSYRKIRENFFDKD
jgi:cytochrome c biogenesis protein CcdA